jgi:hypothetical protein
VLQLTIPSAKEKNKTFHLLDFPENIRMRIYGFVLGFNVIHIDETSQFEGNSETDFGFTHRICDSSLALCHNRKYDEIEPVGVRVHVALWHCGTDGTFTLGK